MDTKKLLINFQNLSKSEKSEELREKVFLLAVNNNILTYQTNTDTTFRFVSSQKDLEAFSTLLKTELSEIDFKSLNITAIF